MMEEQGFFRALVVPALSFFLIPACTLGFGTWGEAKLDGMVVSAIERNIDALRATDEEKAGDRSFVEQHPPSSVCFDSTPGIADYRADVCPAFSDTWQFAMANLLAVVCLGIGVLTFLLIGALGLLAWKRPRAQYASFMFGWRTLVGIFALVTLAQGLLLIFLSYWVTALLFEVYWPKLIIVAVVLAGVGIAVIIRALFHGVPDAERFEGEMVTLSDAPRLWERVNHLAARVGTAPPSAIVAGIDASFFVTEHGLTLLDGRCVEGRVLYVSVPLLRVLAPSEADAIFGHELEHFHGGDTAELARLAPELVRFDLYRASLSQGGVTLIAMSVMRLYRAVFELALKKESRRRELAADATAVRLTSPDDIARSLLKVAAYSSFRLHTERALFLKREAHQGELELRQRIAAGLSSHVTSRAFAENVEQLEVPHPFDSHPPLSERLAQAGSTLVLGDAARVFDVAPQRTWADEIATGETLEGLLWGAYESRFKTRHVRSLAWKYRPANEAEKAVVLQHFPNRQFDSKKGGVFILTYDALTVPNGEQVRFVEIGALQIDEGTFSNTLVISRLGSKPLKVNLNHLGKDVEAFKSALATYWDRDRTAAAGAEIL